MRTTVTIDDALYEQACVPRPRLVPAQQATSAEVMQYVETEKLARQFNVAFPNEMHRPKFGRNWERGHQKTRQAASLAGFSFGRDAPAQCIAAPSRSISRSASFAAASAVASAADCTFWR